MILLQYTSSFVPFMAFDTAVRKTLVDIAIPPLACESTFSRVSTWIPAFRVGSLIDLRCSSSSAERRVAATSRASLFSASNSASPSALPNNGRVPLPEDLSRLAKGPFISPLVACCIVKYGAKREDSPYKVYERGQFTLAMTSKCGGPHHQEAKSVVELAEVEGVE